MQIMIIFINSDNTARRQRCRRCDVTSLLGLLGCRFVFSVFAVSWWCLLCPLRSYFVAIWHFANWPRFSSLCHPKEIFISSLLLPLIPPTAHKHLLISLILGVSPTPINIIIIFVVVIIHLLNQWKANNFYRFLKCNASRKCFDFLCTRTHTNTHTYRHTYACKGICAFMHSASSSIHQGHCSFFFLLIAFILSSSLTRSFTRSPMRAFSRSRSLSLSGIVRRSSLVYVSTQATATPRR